LLLETHLEVNIPNAFFAQRQTLSFEHTHPHLEILLGLGSNVHWNREGSGDVGRDDLHPQFDRALGGTAGGNVELSSLNRFVDEAVPLRTGVPFFKVDGGGPNEFTLEDLIVVPQLHLESTGVREVAFEVKVLVE
jgi:hypothetical protein